MTVKSVVTFDTKSSRFALTLTPVFSVNMNVYNSQVAQGISGKVLGLPALSRFKLQPSQFVEYITSKTLFSP